jgi:hypothetical protein
MPSRSGHQRTNGPQPFLSRTTFNTGSGLSTTSLAPAEGSLWLWFPLGAG